MERPAEDQVEEIPPPVVPVRPDEFRRDRVVRLIALGLALAGLSAAPLGSTAKTILGEAGILCFGVGCALVQLRWWRIKRYMWGELTRHWDEER